MSLIERVFDAICHRDPARSFLLSDGSVSVCARCTGMYLGAWIGALAVLALWIFGRQPAGRTLLWGLLAGIAATPLEVLAEAVAFTEGTNAVRLALGLLTGSALAFAMGISLPQARPRRKIPAWIPVAGIVLVDILLTTLILSARGWGGFSVLGGILLLASGVGAVFFFWARGWLRAGNMGGN